MNPTRRRRLILVTTVLAATAVAVSLTVFALQNNMNYLLTPSQVSSAAGSYRTFRLGGMVKAGSVVRSSDSLKVDFTVVDAHGAMPVQYTGILPDLFRDNQSVIATGHMDQNRFIATEVLAKHDETYMPKELKDALAEAHGGKAGTRDRGPGTE